MSYRGEKTPVGVLYVVATPIGNLDDITYRAVAVLKSAGIVAAEDTRHTAGLFSRYKIDTPMISCHEHNESKRAELLIEKLKSGTDVALVSDAGTPSVSDPGYRVVSAALEAGIKVVPVPGVSAPAAALSVSGLPSDRFCFAGFPPRKKAKRSRLIAGLAESESTLIFYESPRRLFDLLKTLHECLGDRQAVIAREMTKRHEEFIRGSITELISRISERFSVKGEVTVLVSGKAGAEHEAGRIPEDLARKIRERAEIEDLSPSRLAAELAASYGLPKNRIYRLILESRKNR